MVDIDVLDGGERKSSQIPKLWIIRNEDDVLVNRELIRSGYAFLRKGSPQTSETRITNDLLELEKDAKQKGLGIYKTCDEAAGSAIDSGQSFVAEFEEMEYTTQIQYGDDGGKEVLVGRESSSSPPRNPGDTKGCSDFEVFEDALAWYERYYPYYGDVAKLDRRGDGIPCRGLPHTQNGERYRIKKPTSPVVK